MKTIRILTLLCFSSCAIFCSQTKGAEIQPSVVLMPGAPGEPFSFDLVISEDPGISAQGFQAVISSITGPGGLSFNIPYTVAVAVDTDYWLSGNSAGVTAFYNPDDDSYTFGDGPGNGVAQAPMVDNIVARYAFIWDGPEAGNYTFTFNLNTGMSYFLLEDLVNREALQLSGGGDSFTVYIPEPATLALLGLGCLSLLKHRRP
ncbi:MAG: PEP-CTERM sorting domain-containing protein [Planctomycetota bacterium]|jgi:hypothetical protein